jgi:hypothetical protein|tara:strand:+ start:822 stop:1268 length:447 start_codon:yes stop_codon:yes gene_type:complete
MSKTITLPLDEYEAIETNAKKFLQIKNIEAETERLEVAQVSTIKKLKVERDSLYTEISCLDNEATKLREHLKSEQANMPIVLEDHHRYNFMRVQSLVPFNRIKPYYENDVEFVRFIKDIESKTLKSKHSIVSFILLCIFSFFAGALLL